MGYRREEPIRWHEGKHGMFLESPYKKRFVEDLKIHVPREERKWSKDKLQWWVSDLYLDEVDNLIFHHFERSATGRD